MVKVIVRPHVFGRHRHTIPGRSLKYLKDGACLQVNLQE